MCGICGVIFKEKSRKVPEKWLMDMTSTMKHRGPDGSGIFIERNVGLGHRRLSIIDLDTGQQPMSNAANNVVIVFNGEIYNFPELKERLKALGHTFRTRSDTEVIIHAYEEWGQRCVDELRGMFAFAIFDLRTRDVFLARDRLGIKPLYYYYNDQFFVFASEIKAILKSGLVKAEVNKEVIDHYINLGYVPAPFTLFKGIKKVRPGYTMSVNFMCQIKERCFWDIPFRDGVKKRSFMDYSSELKELLIDCVKSHLISDVPLGVFLSGGVDSSAVVAFMTKELSVPVKTFSVGYDGNHQVSELKYARKVANLYHTDHHEFILRPEPFFESLDTFLDFSEEPVVESAAIALHQLAKLAKPEATVLLSGEGADEVLAGYPIYGKMMFIEKLYGFVNGSFLSRVIPAGNTAIPEKLRKYLHWIHSPFDERYRTVSCDVIPSVRNDLYTKEFNEVVDDSFEELFRSKYSELKDNSMLQKMLYVDTKYWLPDDLLLKADKSTMAASIELRVPFLDHKLIEYACTIPDEYKNNGAKGKVILKKIMEDYLPHEIIYRRKMGFPVPIAQWFASELYAPISEILLAEVTINRGYFNKRYLQKILKLHRKKRGDYSRRIMSLLTLELWHRKYLDA